ncbi:MAG: efflux RND transporter periplasmic adaptor subunit [Candidatus Acidiferrales bacterium]|jgi:HlyD family secretion protein
MTTGKKIAIGAGVAVVLGVILWASVYQANKDVTAVQTGTTKRGDLTSVVTASGEVRPLTYSNILGEGIGKITAIVVKEGDHVHKGDVLLKLESIQPAADVEAQQAGIESSESAVQASQASLKSAQATLAQRQADYEKAKFDWERSQKLYDEQLIAKQDYDAQKSTFDGASAGVDAAKAQLSQSRAMLEEARHGLDQNRAVLVHQKDVLRKTTYTAPIDGIVSYIAVRVGENVVPGIQNATGSYLMTISDMSVVTAEVKVDETDIVNVRNAEEADIKIDAIPGKTFTGHVTEVGDQAILRSSGLATTQTTANTQEARDFKVVVRLDNPPDNLRPGLSVTATIKTSSKKDVLTIPIQALAMRSKRALDEAANKSKGGSSVTLAATRPDSAAAAAADKQDIQGVFVLRGRKAEFVPVQTGISGVTDIEIVSGLNEGDQIVTGSYKALRTLRPGANVKVDNSEPKRDEQQNN